MADNKNIDRPWTKLLPVFITGVVFLVGCMPFVLDMEKKLEIPITEIPIELPTIEITAEVQEKIVTIEPVSDLKDSDLDITITPRPSPQFWQEMPVIPSISERAIKIYKEGLRKGNNPHSFSKIGDCESRTTWFFYDFDMGEKYYSLGDYESLRTVIENYSGSFSRLSMVAKPGFNAASVMVPIWSDKEKCEKNESPLACEFRVHKPSVAFIMLGTNDVYQIDSFENNLRRVIDYSIESGVVPILSTKADNLEGDHYINAIIAHLAYEYDVPLWNFWAAVQSLPDHGLQEDGVHLTWAPNQFDDPKNMERAWPVRNLTALQVLNAVWNELSQHTEG